MMALTEVGHFSYQGTGGTSLVGIDWMALRYQRGSTKDPAFLRPPGILVVD